MSGVVSVGAAIGATALAADAVATAGFTIGSAMMVTGAIGATVGAIGTLTGNKTLGMAGMALGAVGAIGGFAGMAGAFDSAASIGSLAETTGGVGEMGGQVAAGQSLWGSGSQDVISGITGATAPADTLPTMAPTDQFGHVIQQGDGRGGTLGSMPNPAATENTPGVLQTAPAAGAPAAPGGATAGTPAPGGTAPGPYQVTVDPTTGTSSTVLKPGVAQPTTPLSTAPGSWDNIMAWVEKHPALALSGVTAASSFLSGAFNPKTPAEVNALNAQAAKSQADVGLIGAQTGLINQRIANSSAVPIATRTRTNAGTGLIGQPGVT